MEGSGQFLVLAVGLNSQNGNILKLMGAAQGKEEEEESDDDENFDQGSIKSKLLSKNLRIIHFILKEIKEKNFFNSKLSI